jgi:hypothetical protein
MADVSSRDAHARLVRLLAQKRLVLGVIGGVTLGALALTIGVAVWFLVILPRIKDQVYARSYAFVTSSPAAFAQAWEARAITLRAGAEECRPPDGDWIAFVRATPTREEEEEGGHR